MNVSDLPNRPLSPYDAFFYLARNTCAKRKVDSHYDNATTLEDFLTDNDVSAKRRKIDTYVGLELTRIAQENEERRMNTLREGQENQKDTMIASFNNDEIKTPTSNNNRCNLGTVKEANEIASLENEEVTSSTRNTPPCELFPSGEPKTSLISSRPCFSGDAFCTLPLERAQGYAISNTQNTQPPANNGVFFVNNGIARCESMGTAQTSLLYSVTPLQTRSIINTPIEASKVRFPPRSLEVYLPGGNCIPYMPTTESGTKK